MDSFSGEPLSPAARMMVQPGLTSVIYTAVGLKNPVDLNALKSTLKNSLFVTHPRFRSLLFRDGHGRECWKPTEVNLDSHIFVTKGTGISDDPEKIANEYVADLLFSPPLSPDKPLWEIHVLEKCLVFRIHHAIGDGMSLMSMLLDTCRKAADPESPPTLGGPSSRRLPEKKKKRNLIEILIEFIKTVFFALVYSMDFMMKLFGIPDRKTVISGGEGVELWPRKIANAQFSIKHMKMVKEAVGDATINEVLMGVVAAGLSRYLDHRSPKSMKEGQKITGLGMINLREQQGLQDVRDIMKKDSKCRWGNEVNNVLVPIYYEKGIEPLQYIKNAQKSTQMKRIGAVVKCSRQFLDVFTLFSDPKTISGIGNKLLCSATFGITNIMGPQEEITIAGNPITSIRVCISASPLALTMAMVSYNGKADMQISVAKDIIPDPEFLTKCFEDCLLEMTEAAAKI